MLFKNILVYVDNSESAIEAAMYAIILAQETGANLSVLYVVDTKSVSDLYKAHIFVDIERVDYERDLEKDADKYIRHIRKMALKKSLNIVTEIIKGNAPVEVDKFIKANSIDLLVLPKVSNIRSRREELTSDLDRILRTSKVPVLVVRADEEIWDRFDEGI
ncbi:MAG: universal stress protein [Sphaerochaetaceae bacterium]